MATSLHQGRHSVARVMNSTHQAVSICKGSAIALAYKVDPATLHVVAAEDDSPPQAAERLKVFSDVAKREGENPLDSVVIGEQLSRGQKETLVELLQKHEQVFSTPSRPIGCTTYAEHAIDTGDSAPLSCGLRPSAPRDRETQREEISKMLEYNVIESSNSPWASPIVMVVKKDGSARFCVDYRRLNKTTKKDVHPLPRTSDLLEALGRAAYFSTLDAASGYWQIPVREEDREKTAFISSSGLYQFRTCRSDYVMRPQHTRGS